MNWQQAVEKTVTGLGYELVDCVFGTRGLLVVTVDRLPDHVYPSGPGVSVTVDDCELVTRQLQYLLEVENVDYARLEVSSPGLDRPLRTAEHYERFMGAEIDLTLKVVFQGRKKYRGLLARAESGYELLFKDGKEEKVLGFDLSEVREARLVPVIDFRKGRKRSAEPSAGETGTAHAGDHEE